MRATRIELFRNGMFYGSSYVKEGPVDRLYGINNTRMVFGVRSSAFADPSLDPGAGAIHGKTHSPYFEGRIYNITILKNALSLEEVRGLYAAPRGGTEVGCHCFDACPVGRNRFYPDVDVPCSGQGV